MTATRSATSGAAVLGTRHERAVAAAVADDLVEDDAVAALRRASVAGLSLSAFALVALLGQEGYTDRAVIPVQNDRPTIGHGSTFRDDGTPVQLGDTITPTQALKRSYTHIAKDETKLRQCVTAPLFQHEYDAFVQLAYNIGTDAFCKSTLVKHLNAGNYEVACKEILRWDKFKGKPLRGLVIRRQAEYKLCSSGGTQ